jgi:putative transcriptional regulator
MLKRDTIVMPADPDDPEDGDVTAEGLERGLRARTIRKIRSKLGLTQVEFAERFCVPVGTLRDWEQARVTPPDFAVAYIRVIGQHPDIVEQAIAPAAA